MAIKFSEIDEAISRSNPSDFVDKASLAKLQAARDFVKTHKLNNDDIRATLFAGYLMDDQDAWRYLFKIFPRDRINDILETRLGGTFRWSPEQVARLMGTKDPINLVKTPEGSNIPQWKIGRGETPEEIIASYANQYPELDAKKLYGWLDAYQRQYDNQKKYTGGGINALRTVFAPRIQESLLRKGDYDRYDVIGDIGENVLLAVPTDRLVNMGALGLKAGLLPNLGGKTLTAMQIGGNFAMPAGIELMDKALYNKPGDTRGEISPSNILTLGGINLGASAGLGRMAKESARKTGTNIPSSVFSTDPFGQYVREYVEGGIGGKARSPQAKKSAEVIEIIDKTKADPKKVKELQDQKLKDMEEWLATGGDPKDPTAIERYRQKYNEIVLSDLPPDKRKEALELLQQENPSRLYESDYLPEEMQKSLGISESGYVGNVTSDFTPLSSGAEYGLEFFVPEERSFYNLKKAEKKKHRNKSINRESEGDKALTALREKPEIAIRTGAKGLGGSKLSSVKALLDDVPVSYVKNKLGKESMSLPIFEVVGDAIEEKATKYSPEVKAILDDPLTLRIWETTTIRPRVIPGDPLWEAYKIKYPEKAKEMEEEDKSSKIGKKAGF